MRNAAPPLAALAILLAAAGLARARPPAVNDAPAGPGEWGFRPSQAHPTATNPPGFVWRPQKQAAAYEMQVARDPGFTDVVLAARGIAYNCYCPPKLLPPGEKLLWRFRFVDGKGGPSAWSGARAFTIPPQAAEMPMPPRAKLLGRVPKSHPRLLLRPEDLPGLRKLASGPLKDRRDRLVAECEKLLKNPPPTDEPRKYPKGMKPGSDPWRKIWWGNRRYTIRVLHGAATLAFTRLITGEDTYGREARRLLLAAASWDPKGSTGYRYNDEAGMPYNYYFSRTYSFVHDLLTEAERARCRKVMAVRGKEMYDHLVRHHIWKPYGSHRNRAWHFLGEVGIAFLDELPDAREWVWFAMNVFYNVYPVWSDADGGWHEGVSYWRSYIRRFTWWARAMKSAMGVDAFDKPYFSKVGYYPMYLQPPGTRGGGFGDLCAGKRAEHNRTLMTILAAQARNPHWRWYVEAIGGPASEGGYMGFLRGALPAVTPRKPTALPASRCFRGTGQAMLNTSILDAGDNVEVVFKSSPFGTQSHGYESNNSLLLYAYGRRLLIRTGRRDSYGSAHHRRWMWQTKSTNCVTVGGVGQVPHSQAAAGRIVAFHDDERLGYVCGEAAGAYPKGTLKSFRRHVLMLKPYAVVVLDRLIAPKPTTFQWFLHSPTEMSAERQDDIRVVNDHAAVRAAILAPAGLKLSLTDRFDPPPRKRIKLTEWHLTAETTAPAAEVAFVTVLLPHRGQAEPAQAALVDADGGRGVRIAGPAGGATVLLRTAAGGPVAAGELSTEADVAALLTDRAGKPTGHLLVRGAKVRTGRGPWK